MALMLIKRYNSSTLTHCYGNMNFLNDLPHSNNKPINIGHVPTGAEGFVISDIAKTSPNLMVVITPDLHQAQTLESELKGYLQGINIPVHRFNDWETLPYDHFSPHQDITSERLYLLSLLPRMNKGIIIVAMSTLLSPVPPKTYIMAESLVIKTGDPFDLIKQRNQLEQAGYRAVTQVLERGEYATRGAIIDIFPMGAKQPVRIELFDDEIDTIRIFDPETQCSNTTIQQFILLPAKEFPLTDKAKQRFEENWDQAFNYPGASVFLSNVLKGHAPAGIEYYLPLFFETRETFFDYLPKETLILSFAKTPKSIDHFWQTINERYHQLHADILRPILPPEDLFMTQDDFKTNLDQYTNLRIYPQILDKTSAPINLPIKTLPPLSSDKINCLNESALTDFLTTLTPGTRCIFCAQSPGKAEKLGELLANIDLKPTLYSSFEVCIEQNDQFGLLVSPINHGFWLPNKMVLICESDLFTPLVKQKRPELTKNVHFESVIKDLSSLKIGDAVVHLEHGVGRYLGIQTITTADLKADYLTLEYLDHNKLYVPITSLNLISRYSGVDNKTAPMHRLGKNTWSKAKDKALKQIRDVAAELLDIYSKRDKQNGFQFKIDSDYDTFSAEFPFEETQDQANAIDAVLHDLQHSKPMDRLLCGDVGFGKTEVAMRAAFIAAQNGKQVAVLVPTTLLANQHFTNFIDRFASWPINVEMLSRFKTPKAQKEIITKLALGQIDIIIGTHKLLSNTIKFKNLGLLVIDEEHRFGVRHKEKIKALRTNVDILTLSATPIPRTLNMAMSEIRDLSIIATAPLKRQNIETFVYDYNPHLIKEAISREISRGGQVYFLHNEVLSMGKVHQDLTQWFPDLSIAMAHGQMPERELEGIMAEFYRNHYHILICSTIIESGIDVPNANTIIINKADKFGLGQLHQIRGRVGRSHHQAYAYLYVQNKEALGQDAKRRLHAFEQADSLGAGFILASHDLEIRGAGELLGGEQSGHLQSIGFNLYMDLLKQATKALKNDQAVNLEETIRQQVIDIDLGISTIIPDTYLGDVNMRLGFYKRISSANTSDALSRLEIEMIDRFGRLPEPTKQLFEVSHLQLKAKALNIKELTSTAKRMTLTFSENTTADATKIISLVKASPQTYQFAGSHKLVYLGNFSEPLVRIKAADTLLTLLAQ